MNEDVLVKCDFCDNLFNPGILKEAYPWGFITICDKCYNDLLINQNF